MISERCRSALKARPFRPFVLRTADGDRYEVRHPEMAWQSAGGLTAVVGGEGESFAILDLLLVTALEFEDAAR